MTSTRTTMSFQALHKDPQDSSDANVYPSPSLSPATAFQASMHEQPSHTARSRRRSSVKALLSSSNPPASPLDALVMALEATVEEEESSRESGQLLDGTSAQAGQLEEDPDATIPSSPTLFMKRPATGPSLHHLPTLLLPESASAATASQSSGLTPTTQPNGASVTHGSQRKMSISSQGSVSSTNSTGERTKEYACAIGNCEKKFYQVAHLRSHERCHSGTRPYVCRFDGCDRAFSQLGNLKTHERKHTGERPYKCPHPDCDKTFTQLGNLKTHERIHDEVKPFMCRLPGCGKTFSQLGNLKTHTTKMHPEVSISDEELSVRTSVANHGGHTRANPSSNGSRLVPGHESGVVQVIAHFSPYQRRPIKPQQSEEERLLRKIRAMIHHQQRVRELEDGSEVSDEMDE
ncbi:hypothetical protein KVV02_008024 [Mortierella alpina]|uniref:C2H2-type domain-containing protein n=1 Tax=Mortierella alpina TaxID=64518 RepID=A0A9P8A9K9_MORAP|nr:hypothetical protein KVV02_008024 [Mortierella alpina]